MSGTRRWTGLLLSAVTLGAVLYLTHRETKRASPGPLAPAHASLAGPDGCERCHDSGADSFAPRCADCHREIADAIAAGRGLHGRVDTALAERCETCHVEHHGADVPAVAEASFARAGYESRDRYDHAGLEWDLDGAHAELGCEACHRAADRDVLAEGEKRYLGLAGASCTACHDDEHRGAFGTDCARCHGQSEPFADSPGFRHAEDFPLTEGHANVACARCHDVEGADPIADLVAEPGRPARACSACHENPHRRGATATASAETPPLFLPEAGACSDCHGTASFAGVEYGVAEHARIGVTLDGAHAKADCRGCHTSERRPESAASGAKRLEACATCHDDPHATGADAAPAFAVEGCADCHGVSAFRPSTVTSADHARFGRPLEGEHRRAKCTDCHAAKATLPAPDDCGACHESLHREGSVEAVAARADLDARAACRRCHDAAAPAFRRPDARMSKADHAAVGFSLDEPHADLACDHCHDGAELAAVDGSEKPAAATFADRFPGRAEGACASCHGDPHEGTLAKGAFAGSACLDCHRETAFRPSTLGPAEHAKTRFPLAGAHEAVACVSCHDAAESGGGLSPAGFAGTPRACEKCHDDPHEGRFDRDGLPASVDGRERCERCHGTTSFSELRIPRFDHARWTGKELVGRHAEASCRDCHRPPADAAALRTFGPAPERCDRCHSDPHAGQFARLGKTDCARCHGEAAASFTEVRFDHARTRFPLDGRHARVDCASCHPSVRALDGREVVRYRPVGRRCADCHDEDGRRGRKRGRGR